MWGGDKASLIALAWEVISRGGSPKSRKCSERERGSRLRHTASGVCENKPRRSQSDQTRKEVTAFRPLQVRLVVEVLWPLFLFLILVWVRSTSHPLHKGQCKYEPSNGAAALRRSS